MILTDWNVWHSYSTYFMTPVDLASVARSLVDRGVVELAFRPDGHVWWRQGEDVLEDQINITKRPYFAQADIALRTPLPDYPLECAFQAASMQVTEDHILSQRLERLPDHIRCYVSECRVRYDGLEVIIYPQVKLFEDGVILTELRTLSGSEPMALEQFVEDHVNAYRRAAKEILVPPGLILEYARAAVWRQSHSPVARLKGLSLLRTIGGIVERGTVETDDGEFSFRLFPLGDFPLETVVEGAEDFRSLRSLARMIEGAVGEAIAGEASNARFLVRGPRAVAPMGNFWSGRPSVHLVSFRGQPKTTQRLLPRFKNQLASIMYRSADGTIRDVDEALGVNLRPFDDYAVFVNKSLTLWVSAKKALSEELYIHPDKNWGHVVCDKQIQAEFIDYLQAAHHQFEELASTPSRSIGEITRREQELLRLERTITSITAFGEIGGLFRSADECMELDRLRAYIRENLRSSGILIASLQESAARRFSWLLTILIGSAGIPALASAVVLPLWELRDWWLPNSAEARTLFSVAIAGAFVSLLLLALWVATAVRTGRR